MSAIGNPHWNETCLADEALFSIENGTWTGKTPPLKSCAVVRNTNFTNEGKLDLSDVAVIPLEERHILKKRLLPGDIIVERSGGGPSQPVGRVVMFEGAATDYCFSNFTSRIRVNDRSIIDPEFLLFSLLQFHMSGKTEALQRRTTGIRNLAFDDYKKSAIPLPPLAEQRMIASTLRTVEAAKDARRLELNLEHERKAALMAHVFTEGLRGEERCVTEIGSLPKSWKVIPLGDAVHFFQYGTSKKCVENAIGFPVLRIPNIVRGEVDTSELKYLAEAGGEATSLLLQPGDLIFVRTNGQQQYVGRCSMYRGEPANALFASYLIRARLKPVLSAAFVQMYTMTDTGRSFLSGKASNAADGKFNINTQTLRRVLVPVPSPDEQQRIEGVIDACSQKLVALGRELLAQEELFRGMLEELILGRLSTAKLLKKGEAA